MSNAPLPPPGMTGGMPPEAPDQMTGEILPGDMGSGPPPGGMPPPDMMMGMPPTMSAGPYVKRALGLFGRHKTLVAASIFLSLIITLLPFVVSAFSSLMEILGRLAGSEGIGLISQIWNERSLYSKADLRPDSNHGSPRSHLYDSFIVWAALIFEPYGFLRSGSARSGAKALTEIRRTLRSPASLR